MSGATAAGPGDGWRGHLTLDYRRDGARTIAHDQHEGPLRVLRRLYPEGEAVCHHVLVHPPGGIVGGDSLALEATLAPGSHALITTPGATRFYRSAGAQALQHTHARLAEGARLEWLPMETIVHRGCLAQNRLCFELEPGASMIGWDVLALGLPAAGEPFDQGRFLQRLALPGRWLEQGWLDGEDRLLMQSPLGLAGQPVLATLWLADGQPIERTRREALLDAARALIDADAHGARAGVSAPDDALLVLRMLAGQVEPAMALLRQVWAAWRLAHWGLPAVPPRLWRT